MRSKFFLSGGGISFENSVNFYREMASSFTKQNLLVLSVGFASGELKDRKEMDLTLQNWASSARYLYYRLSFINPHKTFECEPASLNLKELEQQVIDADIIFVHGGDGDLLQTRMGKLRNLKNLIANDKALAGSSAGANMWADSYFSNDNDRVCLGLKIIPIKTFCHYDSTKWKQLNEITRHHPLLPTIILNEQEFVIYTEGDERIPRKKREFKY